MKRMNYWRISLGFICVLLIVFAFQNCSQKSFNLDYKGLMDSYSQSSETPMVALNNNRATKISQVPVAIDPESLKQALQQATPTKMRFSYSADKLASVQWVDFQNKFMSDLGDEYDPNGKKDGLKTLYIDLQVGSNSDIVPINGQVVLDTVPPTVSSFTVNSGQPETTRNFNTAQIKAVDQSSPIVSVCLNPSTNTPAVDDPCWTSLSTLGLKPRKELSTNDVPYLIGFLQGTYNPHLFLQDEAGNISQSLDTSIVYNPPVPPSVTDVFAANREDMSIPPKPEEMKITSNEVFLRWKIVSTTPLVEKPIRIYLTQDEKNYQVLKEGLANGANGGCSLSDGTTGCIRISGVTFPSGYFRLRVSAEDQNGQIAMGSSLPLNTGNFQVIAGNTDPGLGGSATTAMLFNYLSSSPYEADPQSFVITNKGQIVFRDVLRGLLIADPKDGILRTLLPLGSKFSEGPLAEAQLNLNTAHIALDYKGGILVADAKAIRRIDLEQNEIRTVVGGGSSMDDGVGALDFKFSTCLLGCPIYPLPNGDIFFSANDDQYKSFSQGARLRRYVAAEKIVRALDIHGTAPGPGGDVDLQDPIWRKVNFVIGFDELTSKLNFLQVVLGKEVVGGRLFLYATINPETMESVPKAEQFPSSFSAMYLTDSYVTDRSGGVYAISRYQGALKKLDRSQKQWVNLLGLGYQSQCEDAVKATDCGVDLQAAFVGLQGRIFVADRGRIRVLNQDTSLFTVAGQRFNYGDDSWAASARFGRLDYFDRDQNGKLIILDSLEGRIREFARRQSIRSIAGDGSNRDQSPGATALNKPMYVSYWGGETSMSVDPATSDVYVGNSSNIMQLNRASGTWKKIAGGGSTYYYQGQNKLGGDISFRYPPVVLGYAHDRVVASNQSWRQDNNGEYFGCYLDSFQTQNSNLHQLLAGTIEICGGGYGSDGSKLMESLVSQNFGMQQWMASFIPQSNVWLVGLTNSARIIEISEDPTALMKTHVVLPASKSGIASFDRRVNDQNQEIFYYCDSGSRKIYRYNVATGLKTELPLPSDSIKCAGYRVRWDPQNKSVVFPYSQSGLNGLAEILDP
jgi:hypothetical protein